MSTLVLFDLEFTSWPGALESDWSGPGQLREIVQIGALRVRCDDLSVVAEYERLVRPVINPRLSDYFTSLSGISQADVDQDGVEPAAAISDFIAFCGSDPVLSYGNDMVILGENVGWCRSRGEVIEHSYLGTRFVNIRPWINRVAPQTATANCGRLWQTLGLDRPAAGSEHSALFDCYSLAAALAEIAARGHRLPEPYRSDLS